MNTKNKLKLSLNKYKQLNSKNRIKKNKKTKKFKKK